MSRFSESNRWIFCSNCVFFYEHIALDLAAIYISYFILKCGKWICSFSCFVCLFCSSHYIFPPQQRKYFLFSKNGSSVFDFDQNYSRIMWIFDQFEYQENGLWYSLCSVLCLSFFFIFWLFCGKPKCLFSIYLFPPPIFERVLDFETPQNTNFLCCRFGVNTNRGVPGPPLLPIPPWGTVSCFICGNAGREKSGGIPSHGRGDVPISSWPGGGGAVPPAVFLKGLGDSLLHRPLSIGHESDNL